MKEVQELPESSPEVRLSGFMLNLQELDPDFKVPKCLKKTRKLALVRMERFIK